MKLHELKEDLVKNKKEWVKYKYTKPLKIIYFVDGEVSKKARPLPSCYKYWYVFKNILFLFDGEQLLHVENISEDMLCESFDKVEPKVNKNLEKSIKKKEEKAKKDKNEKVKRDKNEKHISKQEVLDRLSQKFIGKKFEKLTCIEYLYTKNRQHFMKCICECGRETIIRSQDLCKAKSCGCYRKKRLPKELLPFEKEIRSRYQGIKRRCYNEADRGYKWYGAKGVTMCDEWLNDFYSFYSWCMSNGFKKELHIDKDELCIGLGIHPHIYSPDTCKFITLEENNRHQSSNYKIEYEGIEYNLADLSRKLGISRDTLKIRYEKGLDLNSIVEKRDYTNYYSTYEIAEMLNISVRAVGNLYSKSDVSDKILKMYNISYLEKKYFENFKNSANVKAYLCRQ